MLLERAFVFGVSGRALLAVAAVALSAAYAVLSAGALAGLEGRGATLEEAEEDPGWVLTADAGADFLRARAPDHATVVDAAEVLGVKIATLEPWPHAANDSFRGPHARGVLESVPGLSGLNVSEGPVPYQPWDAWLVPPSFYAAAVPTRADLAVAAYVPGDAPPASGLNAVPWRGVAPFFEDGAAQITSGLVLVVIASGLVASLLASGFVRLEVLARQADLATLDALAGRAVVRRVVTWRAVTLAAAGALLGVGAAPVLLALLSRAVDAPLSASPWVVLGVLVAVGGGSTALGVLAGRRALTRTSAARGGGGITARRFPGPVRFLFVTPRLFPGVFAATVVTVAILSTVLASSAVPLALFGTDEDEVLVLEGTGNPLRGTADRFLGENARFLEGVDTAYPETFAPSVVADRPVMVKGTDFVAWREATGVTLRAGVWPEAEGEATIGDRAARVLRLDLGDRVVVPASYHKGVEFVEIVGIHIRGGLEDDEIYTDLGTAGRLAGLGPNKVSLVRISLEDDVVDWREVAPGAGVQVLDVRITPDPPIPLAPALVKVHVANFGESAASRTLTLRLNGNVTSQFQVMMDGRSSETLDVPVVVPAGARLRMEVNPTTDVDTVEGSLQVTTSQTQRPGQPFVVHVADEAGDEVAGAAVLVDGERVGLTDAAGDIDLTIADPRLAVITAEWEDEKGGIVVRVAPEPWDFEARLVGERFHFGEPAAVNESHFRIPATATVVNLGGLRWNGTVDWTANGTTVANTTLRLDSAARATVSADLDAPFGRVAFALPGLVETVEVVRTADGGAAVPVPSGPGSGDTPDAPAPDPGPQTVEEFLAQRLAQARAGGAQSDEERIQDFLDQVFATLETATVLVVIATFVHAGALVWVGVVREMRERQAVVDALRAIGASDTQRHARVARDTVLSLLPGLVAGIVMAVIALRVAAHWGFPAAFGHTMPVDLSLGLMLRLGAGILVIGLAAGMWAERSATTKRAAPRGPDSLAEWAEAMR